MENGGHCLQLPRLQLIPHLCRPRLLEVASPARVQSPIGLGPQSVGSGRARALVSRVGAGSGLSCQVWLGRPCAFEF